MRFGADLLRPPVVRKRRHVQFGRIGTDGKEAPARLHVPAEPWLDGKNQKSPARVFLGRSTVGDTSIQYDGILHTRSWNKDRSYQKTTGFN
jgi:hypothetical protein